MGARSPTLGIFQQRDFNFSRRNFFGGRTTHRPNPRNRGKAIGQNLSEINSAKTKYLEIPIQIQISGPLGIFPNCKTGLIELRKTLSYTFMYALYGLGALFCVFINFIKIKNAQRSNY